MKSWTKPTSDLVDQALASAVDYEQRRYFFSRLENPLWAKPLAERDCFLEPPAIRRLGDGYLQFPLWPESQFLARVAKETPQDAVEIAEKIRPTDNPRVQEDIMDIALAVEDGKLSARLFPQVDYFAESSFLRWSADKFGKLISHWATHGATEVALRLARKVIRWQPDPLAREKQATARREPANLFVRPEPQPIFDQSEYDELLTEITPPLTRAAPLQTVGILADSLAAALALSKLDADSEPGYDGSEYWCRRIDVAEEYESSSRSYLVRALARACEIAINVAPTRFDELDSLLREQKWNAFSRIRWHAYAQFPAIANEAIREDIRVVEWGPDGHYGFEFMVMLRVAAKQRLLSHAELEGVFDKILADPDLARYRERSAAARGMEPSEADIQSRLNYLYLRKMFPFKSVLPEFPKLWQRYQGLVQVMQEPGDEDYCAIGRAEAHEVVPRSPITAEELESKSDDEVIRYLNTWKPPKGEFEDPSVSGLSGTFATLVRRNPDRFLRIAGRLKLREPTYVRDFLYFCGERVQKKEFIPWAAICELGQWIVEHDPRHAEPHALAPETDDFANLDWTSSREALAHLLTHGFRDYAEAIPFELRSPAFEILNHLVTEFDPRLEGEQSDDSQGRDPFSRAINSVRGESMHALIEHALWIRRHLKRSGKASVSMQDMPEVREALEARLDVNQEPSTAVRSIYGQLTPWLCNLDVDWFRQVSPRIFPREESLKAYWLAAWNTYVRYSYPDILLFDIIEPNYKRAVELLGERPESKLEHEVTEGLGRHLIRLYWWGRISISVPDSLLEKFLKKTNPKQRSNVMNHVGRSLEKSDEVPKEITHRLRAYWDFRLASAKAAQKRDEFSEELCDFAWWFKSGKFEEEWCLQQVSEYLEVITKLDDSTFLIEALAESSERHPKASVQCFLQAVRKMSQQQFFYVREDEAKRILHAALANEAPEVREIGKSAQDFLLRLGRFEFKNIANA